MAAVGAALAEGINPECIQAALEAFVSVPGRFELVDGGQDFSVIVDYAHTPDGLENILHTARQIAKKRIITVFGCGGDRDRGKRPLMTQAALQGADIRREWEQTAWGARLQACRAVLRAGRGPMHGWRARFRTALPRRYGTFR